MLLPNRLGRGGLSSVFEHPADKQLAVKIIDEKYLQKHPEHMDKICYQIEHPISPSFKGYRFLWPTEIVFDEDGNPIGFVMPRAKKNTRDLSHLFTSSVATQFKIRVCLNLSRSIRDLHRAGCVRGDIFFSNDLFDDKGNTFSVDIDSIQIGGFPCGVGRDEVCPPELLGQNFEDVIAKKTHDRWILAVVVFRLLMNGLYPHDPRYVGPDSRPGYDERVKKGIWQYGSHPDFKPRQPIDSLPACLQELFRKTFDVDLGHSNPKKRPKMKEWVSAFESLDPGCKVRTSAPKQASPTPNARKPYAWRAPLAAASVAAVVTAGSFSVREHLSAEPSSVTPAAVSTTAPAYARPAPRMTSVPIRSIRRTRPKPQPVYLESTFSFSDVPRTPRSESDTPALIEFLRTQGTQQ